jgi:fatty acid amide hydrolase
MTDDDLLELGAARLAAAIGRGEVSASQAVEAHLRRIDAVNPTLNAVTARRFEAARREAREIDALRGRGEQLPALAGVPITVKDSLDVTGLASTVGLPWRRNVLAACDDPHVARLRAQGAIVVAKTNVAQLLMYYESDNPLFGRTCNPWRADRTCGGSSGGEAALIAARASALGIGSDIGGSVRIPAHFCGIVSLKPTAGRCPDHGRFSFPLGQQAIAGQVGPMARRVDDVALALGLMQAGPEAGIPPLGDLGAVNLRRLRVAWSDHDGLLPAAPALRRAVREAAQALQDAGAQVRPIALNLGALYGHLLALWTADGGAFVRHGLRGDVAHASVRRFAQAASVPRALRGPLCALLRAAGQPRLAHLIGCMGAADVGGYWTGVEALHDERSRFTQALDEAGDVDVLLCPPWNSPAVAHGASTDIGPGGAYAAAINALGWPAGVVPWTAVRAGEECDRPVSRDRVITAVRESEQGSVGLPVGVQVIARPWHDHHALAVMRALETRTPHDSPGRPPLP